jgi:hypothetical protein
MRNDAATTEAGSLASVAGAKRMETGSAWFDFFVAVLATWRLAHLLAHEDGPFDAIVRLRARAGDGHWGRLMDCPYCLSLWFAMPAAAWLTWQLDRGVVGGVPLWLALSGAACLIETGATAFRRRADPNMET